MSYFILNNHQLVFLRKKLDAQNVKFISLYHKDDSTDLKNNNIEM